MAEVAVTIRGTLFDLFGRTQQQVVLQGMASLTGLTIGGGPIYPEGGPPSGAHPEHPIYYPPYPAHPIAPGGPYPSHPIVLPPNKPTDPPTEPPTQPADPAWQWVWNQSLGWHPAYVPGEGDAAPHR